MGGVSGAGGVGAGDVASMCVRVYTNVYTVARVYIYIYSRRVVGVGRSEGFLGNSELGRHDNLSRHALG